MLVFFVSHLVGFICIAPGDYLDFATNATFTPGGEDIMCFNITVNEDQVIENEEHFDLFIERDGFGVLSQSEVAISDTSGKELPSIYTRGVWVNANNACDCVIFECLY